MSATTRNIIIIGSGPAGYTAAIYSARANLNPLVFEGYMAGGQLMITTDVENFPGFPKGVMGPELMPLFKEQAVRFGAECLTQDVSAVDFSVRPFKVTSAGKDYFAHAVIIATGATAKLMGLESEKKLMGRGVSACATCDGAFFRNQKVAVMGGGDSAMEEANFLTRFAASVTIFNRSDKFRASKIMLERAQKNPKIIFAPNTVITECKGDTKLEALKLKDTVSGVERSENFDGFFVAIGHKPNSDLFTKFVECNAVGYVLTKEKSTYTSLEGVFACGDVQDPTYRQAITAAGSGCQSAIDAERWLEAKGLHA
jgi:thioredoxin reductase (NADPH)